MNIIHYILGVSEKPIDITLKDLQIRISIITSLKDIFDGYTDYLKHEALYANTN